MISNEVELSLAYGCPDSLGNEKLLQYVHRNRDHNYLRIANIGEALDRLLEEEEKLLCLKHSVDRENL